MSIKLCSSDGVIFAVSIQVAKCSETIKTMLEDLGIEEENQSVDEIVPLPTVNSSTLKKIVEWANQHLIDKKSENGKVKTTTTTDGMSPWESTFFKTDQATLFDIILAANYLDIKELLDVACTAVANIMKGKTPEEMRKTFNIKSDFTPEEAEQVKRENDWHGTENDKK